MAWHPARGDRSPHGRGCAPRWYSRTRTPSRSRRRSGRFGSTATISSSRRLVAEYKSWEMDVVELLQRTLRPGMTFVDIGANVGYFSVLASRLVGGGGEVIAFEPEPRTVSLLRANLWRHQCLNSLIYPVAAHSETGIVRLSRTPTVSQGPGSSPPDTTPPAKWRACDSTTRRRDRSMSSRLTSSAPSTSPSAAGRNASAEPRCDGHRGVVADR